MRRAGRSQGGGGAERVSVGAGAGDSLYRAGTKVEPTSGVGQSWGRGLNVFGARLEMQPGSD